VIWFLLTLPFRLLGLGFKTGRGSVKLTHRSLRLLGYRRLIVFGAGVGVGLLIAPGPGTELRAKLQDLLSGVRADRFGASGGQAGDLASKVREHLASSPRTWHLPQPAVTALDGGRVTLAGEVPDAAAAADLERTARSVRGVTAIDSHLTIPTA
jgi:hypothetical protein